MSKTNRSFTINIKEGKKSYGHIPHRSGSGTHQDKRTKRCRTRKAATTRAIKENS